MKYNILPVIEMGALEEALTIQYGEGFNDLRQLMFDDGYMNDVYCAFWFDHLEEYKGEYWRNEEDVRKLNCIKTFLQDTFPNYDRVLVDVSW